jgi:hypothetical protein
MDIYHVHPQTGELIGQDKADLDPLDKGNWLIPAHAVTEAPPTVDQGKALVWRDGVWTVVADHRGETWWSSEGQPIVVEVLGDPADQELSPDKPLKPEPTRQEVDAEAARRTKAGFVFQGVHFQFDDLAKSRINGAAAAAHIALTLGGKLPGDLKWHHVADEPVGDFAWIATDNSLFTMDAQTVIAFGQAAARWESQHVFAAKALKDLDPIPADYTDDSYWP